MFDVLLDGVDEFGDVAEDASAKSLVGQISEPSLHKVQPRAARGNKVHVEAWMSSDPPPHLRMLVGRVVVDDEVQVEIERRY
jgi:hypothetical protein